MCDHTQVSPLERAADQFGLRYVKMDGDIAVISNGGSLGLATMDTLNSVGGSVSCQVDIGGQTFHE